MAMGEEVNVVDGQTPDDYHCDCDYCSQVIGELIRPDGTYYSRLERNEYYDKSERGVEKGHIAKTPLHVARWAVQTYTDEGDWVLDPTIGAGTTAVEALTHRRNVAGMELQYSTILSANLRLHASDAAQAIVRIGDARTIRKFLEGEEVPRASLVVTNPPYSGDESTNGKEKDGSQGRKFSYDRSKPNLAFLNEGQEYWDTMADIYSACVDHLLPGGHFVIGVKDMMRKKKPFLLHKDLCDCVASVGGVEFVGTAFLRHHPGTLFMNTYGQTYGVEPPKYQTISVFRKRKPTTNRKR